MGWQDRDYNRVDTPGGYGDGRPQVRFGFTESGPGRMIKWLLFLNIAVFIVDLFMNYGNSGRPAPLSPTGLGAFTREDAVTGLQLWRWVTYQFLHANLMHLALNMFALYMFGPIMENWWGSRRFLAFYLLCGACGAWLYAVLSLAAPELIGATPESILVGASGSIYGILVGCAIVAPNQRVMLLLPPIPMKMRTLALIILGIAAFAVIMGTNNAGGQAAHLGGALFGYALCKNPRSLDWADRADPVSAIARQSRNASARKADRQTQRRAETEAEVDRILIKVKDHGLQSLTDREKRTLQRATDDKQRHAG